MYDVISGVDRNGEGDDHDPDVGDGDYDFDWGGGEYSGSEGCCSLRVMF